MTLAAVFMCCVKMHSCCSEPFPFQLQPSCDRGSVHCFAGFYSAVHGGFAASEHPCDARNGALYEENLPVTEYAQYVRALVHALNCVRGCTISAVAAILREHPELSNRFRKAISRICMDRDAIVRFAVVQCLRIYYDVDNEFSYELIKLLLNADLRILGAPGC